MARARRITTDGIEIAHRKVSFELSPEVQNALMIAEKQSEAILARARANALKESLQELERRADQLDEDVRQLKMNPLRDVKAVEARRRYIDEAQDNDDSDVS